VFCVSGLCVVSHCCVFVSGLCFFSQGCVLSVNVVNTDTQTITLTDKPQPWQTKHNREKPFQIKHNTERQKTTLKDKTQHCCIGCLSGLCFVSQCCVLCVRLVCCLSLLCFCVRAVFFLPGLHDSKKQKTTLTDKTQTGEKNHNPDTQDTTLIDKTQPWQHTILRNKNNTDKKSTRVVLCLSVLCFVCQGCVLYVRVVFCLPGLCFSVSAVFFLWVLCFVCQCYVLSVSVVFCFLELSFNQK
jgi:hypothetical protein